MSKVFQIKAELFEGQHDALIAFYETYPKLFVNKLLLRLCEALMPTYKPNLALFLPHPEVGEAKGRKIAIKVDKDACPMFWDFYRELPYGSRVLVSVNLMNHYVQLVEGNRQLLEQVYWKGALDGDSVAAVASESIAVQQVEEAKPVSQAKPIAVEVEQAGQVGENSSPVPIVDPLSLHNVGL